MHEYGLFGISGTYSFDRILKASDDKLDKLNSGLYQSFDHNYLFVLSDIFADEKMVQEALRKTVSLSQEKERSFEAIYCSVPGYIYILEVAKQRYKLLEYNSETQYRHAMSARRMVIDFENTKHRD